jgi:lipoate-protein ligase A
LIRTLPLTLADLADNLALDEALLLDAEERPAGGVLRLWEWPRPAVVLGAGGRLALDVDEAACEHDGVPVLRRASGGGTVLLGPGCLLYSLILSFDLHPALNDVTHSYAYILDRVRAPLLGAVPGLVREGTSDLAVAGRKCSGNAQQRKSTHLLHHGTLLYAFPLELIGRYLRQPERQPEYRQKREHAEFVTNLPVTRTELEEGLCAAWQADAVLTEWPAERVGTLAEEKYRREEWIRRR